MLLLSVSVRKDKHLTTHFPDPSNSLSEVAESHFRQKVIFRSTRSPCSQRGGIQFHPPPLYFHLPLLSLWIHHPHLAHLIPVTHSITLPSPKMRRRTSARAATITRCHQCEAETEHQQKSSKSVCCLLKKVIIPFYLCACTARSKFTFVLESLWCSLHFVSCGSGQNMNINFFADEVSGEFFITSTQIS